MYDKSNLIKETYITALNKRISIYGSISYFDKKTENEIFEIICPENLLKFFVKKNTNKDSLSFQLTSVSGNLPTLKNQKIHNLSLTQIGRKKNLRMQEPTETVIILAQQNWVLNMLKKHKNVTYKLTPLGIIFPASIKNDTEQVFIMCRKLNKVKKALINSKIYNLIGIIDLKKIDNWKEIKGQSIWINATLEEQKEINNSRHLCFPFSIKTLNDLLNFSIYSLDDNNNEITFEDKEKKISILNFKINLFVR